MSGREADVQRETTEISFTVPLVPPSVNHYKKPRKFGRGFYVTKEAIAFKEAVALLGRNTKLVAEAYSVVIGIFLGHAQKGDIDNFCKVVLDGLVFAGIIHSDAAITELTLRKGRDAKNPRTEIQVKAL
jgi:crossover junction endodeoxyribonuclease RusA